MYEIELNLVEKFILNCPKTLKNQIKEVVIELIKDPYSAYDASPMREVAFECYRCKFGDYRMIYTITGNVILVLKVGHRDTVYKNLNKKTTNKKFF